MRFLINISFIQHCDLLTKSNLSMDLSKVGERSWLPNQSLNCGLIESGRAITWVRRPKSILILFLFIFLKISSSFPFLQIHHKTLRVSFGLHHVCKWTHITHTHKHIHKCMHIQRVRYLLGKVAHVHLIQFHDVIICHASLTSSCELDNNFLQRFSFSPWSIYRLRN